MPNFNQPVEYGEMKEIPYLHSAFAQVLQEIREEARMSQAELADRIGCARSFISFLETRSRLPSLNAFLMISSALHVSPAEFLKRLERKLANLQHATPHSKRR